MGENSATENQLCHREVFDVPIDAVSSLSSNCFDYDGRMKRTGTACTASAHIMTAVIASDIQPLDWAIAQLGWVAGPAVMFLFSFLTYYTSTLLSVCYRFGDPVTGRRNYTYMDAVRTNLGGAKFKICGLVQYLCLFGVAIGYTIASATSMMAIERSTCFHNTHGKDPCHRNSNPYMIAFGVAQLMFSQIPDFDQLWWLSTLSAVMSIANSIIGLALAVAKIAETGKFRGSLTGISIGTVTRTQKIWRSFQALGDIVFGYSYSIILIEIQDTLKSPPSEAETMKKANLFSVVVITFFNMLSGCMAYAAFGDSFPGNLLSPYWLVDLANAALVIHLVGAYQVYCQPLFAFVEKSVSERFPDAALAAKEIGIPIPGCRPYKLNLFRLVWRTTFVITTTVISMLLPFFDNVVGLLGALGFWPLTVYFPVEMYIAQKKMPKGSTQWLCLQILSLTCLIVSLAAAAGSIAGFILDLKPYKPFSTIN